MGVRPGASDAMRDDYYELLGLPRGATMGQVSKAYKRLSLQLHPDKARQRCATVGSAFVAAAGCPQGFGEANTFGEVQEAYRVLSDPGARQRYDERNRWIASHPHRVRFPLGGLAVAAASGPPSSPCEAQRPLGADGVAGRACTTMGRARGVAAGRGGAGGAVGGSATTRRAAPGMGSFVETDAGGWPLFGTASMLPPAACPEPALTRAAPMHRCSSAPAGPMGGGGGQGNKRDSPLGCVVVGVALGSTIAGIGRPRTSTRALPDVAPAGRRSPATAHWPPSRHTKASYAATKMVEADAMAAEALQLNPNLRDVLAE